MSKTTLTDEFAREIARVERAAFVEVVRKQKGLTLRELVGVLEGPHGRILQDLTIGELLEGEKKARRKEPSSDTTPPVNVPAATRGRAPHVASVIEVRTAEGRQRYERSIIDVLTRVGASMSAIELRDAVGGSPPQLRAAVKRLVDAGAVAVSGQASATRYRALHRERSE